LSDTASESPAAAGGAGLSKDERAELERLRAETAESRRGKGSGRRRRPGWRFLVATLLITLGCILAPVSVIAVGAANQVSNTDRYVANIAPLIDSPPIQNALTDQITNQITSRLDVTGYVSQAAAALNSHGLTQVGALLKSAGPSVVSAINGFIRSAVHGLVTSQQFANAWVQVNRVAHQSLVTALSGGQGAVSTSNGQVTIDLSPFINIVKQNLAARGFTLIDKLPTIHPTLSLFSSRELVKAQTAYRLINDLKIVLPILTLVLIAAGVYVAAGRRRALIGAGLGFAASMLVLGIGLLIFRGIYLNSVPSNVLPSDAAAALFDTLVRFIREALRALLVLGLVVALAAFFTGPSATAVKTRGALGSGIDRLRHRGESAGLNTGPVGAWTYSHRMALRISAVALIGLIFVFWGRPTAVVVIVLAVILLVILGLIELIGRPPGRPEGAEASSALVFSSSALASPASFSSASIVRCTT
jgi:hypothetical protein